MNDHTFSIMSEDNVKLTGVVSKETFPRAKKTYKGPTTLRECMKTAPLCATSDLIERTKKHFIC